VLYAYSSSSPAHTTTTTTTAAAATTSTMATTNDGKSARFFFSFLLSKDNIVLIFYFSLNYHLDHLNDEDWGSRLETSRAPGIIVSRDKYVLSFLTSLFLLLNVIFAAELSAQLSLVCPISIILYIYLKSHSSHWENDRSWLK